MSTTNANNMPMEQMVQIRCKNNKKILNVSIGSTLSDIFSFSGLTMEYGPISARVNNKIEGMHYRVYNCKDVEFLSLRHPSALRAYTRSLFFVLCKAVHDLYGTGHVVINVPVSNGYHCDLHIGHQVTDADVAAIRKRMQEIVAAAIPIHRHQATTEDAIRMFREMGTVSKVKLLEGLGSLYTTYYEIDGYVDYYYGSMLTNTGQLTLFGVEPYFGGILLRVPSPQDPSRLGELVRQDKMFDIFMEHHHWRDTRGSSTSGGRNKAVVEGKSSGLTQMGEALQEKKIAQIADEIAKRKNVKMVLIAGPSSSGKTTTCKRLSVQLAVNGIHPIGISLDDYFVNREQTPRDETGDYDYEHLHALNIPLLNEQMNALFRGEEVELPRYNFQMGRSEKSGRRLRLQGNEVLVLEGIHALNPELTASIPNDQIFRVYASALTTILLDTHNYIPTTDNRLLRRIVRDYKYRGVSACDTIRRWPSVRRGENRWIFPYQENADAMFNSAMLFELAVLKNQALPLLEQVPENCEEYAEAYRLMKFLRYIHTIKEDQIPPTSLLREFLGGSSFEY